MLRRTLLVAAIGLTAFAMAYAEDGGKLPWGKDHAKGLAEAKKTQEALTLIEGRLDRDFAHLGERSGELARELRGRIQELNQDWTGKLERIEAEVQTGLTQVESEVSLLKEEGMAEIEGKLEELVNLVTRLPGILPSTAAFDSLEQRFGNLEDAFKASGSRLQELTDSIPGFELIDPGLEEELYENGAS